jgi:hypothetical protein
VEPAGENPDLVFLHLIDESMCLIDSSRLTTGQLGLQGLGLALTGIQVTLNFTNQFHDSKRPTPVFSIHQARSSKADGSNSKPLKYSIE